MRVIDSSPMFGFSVGQDRKNVTKYVPQLGPRRYYASDRDYYLKMTAEM